jgi:hypothetical protein
MSVIDLLERSEISYGPLQAGNLSDEYMSRSVEVIDPVWSAKYHDTVLHDLREKRKPSAQAVEQCIVILNIRHQVQMTDPDAAALLDSSAPLQDVFPGHS